MHSKGSAHLLSVCPAGGGEEEVGEVGGGAEELGAVEVDDDALLLGVGVASSAIFEHEVAHPHVAVADGVEARAEGVAGAPQLDQQLEHLVRDLAQLQHVLLNACKNRRRVKFECWATGRFAFEQSKYIWL